MTEELEELEYCGYCGTYGHQVADCPELPMHLVTITVHVPGSYQDPEEYVRQGLRLPDDVEVQDIIREEDLSDEPRDRD